ncbi:ribonuclease Z [Pseudoduganella sp. GCM10020061]|uniref:ribonuclease Z n=1 Tax=Pseudoduganella sp. GCM10020061 TaxID=3317345 RepID=UPI0036406CE3
MFKLTFLGTSAGMPTKYRNVTSLAVQPGLSRDWWMVDCGEATQHRLQHVPLTVHELAGICITHVHGDHTYGLPGLLASAAMGARKRPLVLIAPRAVRLWLDATFEHTALALPFPLVHVEVDGGQQSYEEAGLSITWHRLSHRVPSVGFRFAAEKSRWKLDTEALRARGVTPGPGWGELQAGRNVQLDDGTLLLASQFRKAQVERAAIVVGGDNDAPQLLADACKGAQLLVHEGTYTEAISQKVGPGPTHSSVQQVAQFAAQAGVPNLILTHFSPRYDSADGMKELEAEARQSYAGQLFLARDLASYELHTDGLVHKLEAAR